MSSVDTPIELRRDDWSCSKCPAVNYYGRQYCHHCEAPQPTGVYIQGWTCSKCHWHLRPSRVTCYISHEPRADIHTNGWKDWTRYDARLRGIHEGFRLAKEEANTICTQFAEVPLTPYTGGASGSNDLPVILEDDNGTTIYNDAVDNSVPIIANTVNSDPPVSIPDLTHNALP